MSGARPAVFIIFRPVICLPCPRLPLCPLHVARATSRLAHSSPSSCLASTGSPFPLVVVTFLLRTNCSLPQRRLFTRLTPLPFLLLASARLIYQVLHRPCLVNVSFPFYLRNPGARLSSFRTSTLRDTIIECTAVFIHISHTQSVNIDRPMRNRIIVS